jgi:PTH1 family peptidyl-tRNA hydrolase
VRLVVGLGNPGPEYAGTRHNLGFRVVEVLAARWSVALKEKKRLEAYVGQGEVAGEPVVLAQPLTYMNLSGQAVAKLLRYWRLAPADLVVLHDDLDVPLGRLKLVERGGPGGHRGVLSIQEALGTGEFLRVKLGIGRPPPFLSPEDYVLSPFSPEEAEAIPDLVARAALAVETLITEGLAAAQNKFHGVS